MSMAKYESGQLIIIRKYLYRLGKFLRDHVFILVTHILIYYENEFPLAVAF